MNSKYKGQNVITLQVVGGYLDGNIRDKKIHKFNFATGTWTQVGTMGDGHLQMAAMLVDPTWFV